MNIEIWSDVMCPFCYIGKRHLEKALQELPFGSDIKVNWKSYQLNPAYKNTNGEDLYTYLSTSKGITKAQAQQMTGQVEQMANNAGLTINFEKNIPANSFNAHRLIHFAKAKGLQDEAEEAIFYAHFTACIDVDNNDNLLEIAKSIGLDSQEVSDMLNSNALAEEVSVDIYESQQIGVRGVPFFLIDKKYTLSGAQPVEVFKQALTQGYTEWQAEQQQHNLQNLNLSNDNTCDEGGCTL